jgi:hypothetical protein
LIFRVALNLLLAGPDIPPSGPALGLLMCCFPAAGNEVETSQKEAIILPGQSRFPKAKLQVDSFSVTAPFILHGETSAS